jgi:hypothetical protein
VPLAGLSRRRNHSELLQHAQRIPVGVLFCHLSSSDGQHADPGHHHLFTGRGYVSELTGVRTAWSACIDSKSNAPPAPGQLGAPMHSLRRRYFQRCWCQVARVDQARRGVPIKPDIAERVERKTPQNDTTRSDRHAGAWVDELNAVTFVQL